jgi:hypothetical protein
VLLFDAKLPGSTESNANCTAIEPRKARVQACNRLDPDRGESLSTIPADWVGWLIAARPMMEPACLE